MSSERASPDLSTADYESIEAAVMETARGRWFLLEYARRQRAAETQRLADAVDRLEAVIAGAAAAPETPAAVAVVSADMAALAERLSDLAWRLREDGAHPDLCNEMDAVIASLRPPGAAAATHARRAPVTDPPPLATPPWEQRHEAATVSSGDPRARALARLDDLPLAEKLALFC